MNWIVGWAIDFAYAVPAVCVAWALAAKLIRRPRRPSHAEVEKRIAKLENELNMPPSTDYGRNTYRAIGPTPTREQTAIGVRQNWFAQQARAMNDDTLAKEVARHCSNEDYNNAVVAEAKRRADERVAAEAMKAAEAKQLADMAAVEELFRQGSTRA